MPGGQIDTDNAAMSIGHVIRALRLERGLTQEELALEAEVATSNVSRVERGERQPTSALLGRLADALGMTISQIYALAEELTENKKQPSLVAEKSVLIPLEPDLNVFHQLANTTSNDNINRLLRYFHELDEENQKLLIEQAKLLCRFQQVRESSK